MRFILLLIALALACPAIAGDSPSVSGVYDVFRTGETSPPVLTAGESYTTKAFPITGTTFQGLSWKITTASGAPSINVIILQANHVSDGMSQWSTSLVGGSPSTNVTITTASGGSSMSVPPGSLIAYRVTNTGTVNATPTIRAYAK